MSASARRSLPGTPTFASPPDRAGASAMIADRWIVVLAVVLAVVGLVQAVRAILRWRRSVLGAAARQVGTVRSMAQQWAQAWPHPGHVGLGHVTTFDVTRSLLGHALLEIFDGPDSHREQIQRTEEALRTQFGKDRQPRQGPL